MKISDNGLHLLAEWEGVVNHTYLDSAGLQSLGVGHLLTSLEKATGCVNIKGQHVLTANGITMRQALDLLAQDVAVAENAVNEHIKVPLTQNQFDALVIFTFNIGTGGFGTSSVLKDINSKDFADVPNDFRKWNKVTINGQHVVDKGLVRRRELEIKLFLS